MESNPKNKFRYIPLASNHGRPIRLLSLLPSRNFDADIECEVFNTSLESKPRFEALSYMWGDPTEVVPTLLHGQLHQVTHSLASALRHLRYPHQKRRLWVDALCINQSDLLERNQQVSTMRDIYTVGGAQRVVVWLGEIPGQIALDFCDKLADEKLDPATILGYHTEWEACHDLFSRNAWWSRAWIVQEVVHTNKVVVHIPSQNLISFDVLCDKARFYYNLLEARLHRGWQGKEIQMLATPIEKNWSATMRGTRRIWQYPCIISSAREEANKLPIYETYLQELLASFRFQQASDFHDHIFAFHCMAFDSPSRSAITIDYRLSKTETYTIASRVCMVKSLVHLLLVESVQKPVSKLAELPSWVIDFTTTQTFASLELFSCGGRFNASKGFPAVEKEPRLLDSNNCKVLTLRGIFVATITGVFKTRITSDEDLIGQDGVKLIRYSKNPYYRRRNFVELPPTPWQTHPAGEDSLIITHNNTSWGPIFSEVGDIIVVVAGCPLPVVLRKFESDKYLFLGACLLIEREIENLFKMESDRGFSDIMHGSVCRGLPQDYESEIFRIY